jgi:energy-coupling factor transport system ATP-binding protein
MPGERLAPPVEVTNVSFAYPASPDVLRDVTFAVERGSVCALLGENGAGKSTLARICAGVLVPREGRVLVDGAELTALQPGERIRRVRVSFQYPEHELFRRTLALELDWEAERLGLTAQSIKERARVMLDHCGFPATLESHPYDLDPWARKLFVNVSALAVPGRFVILDEPTIRLAQHTKARLAEVLLDYVRAGGTILTVTHDYEFCLAACDTVALMANGRIDQQGPVGDVLLADARQSETNIFAFTSYYLHKAAERRARLQR